MQKSLKRKEKEISGTPVEALVTSEWVTEYVTTLHKSKNDWLTDQIQMWIEKKGETTILGEHF